MQDRLAIAAVQRNPSFAVPWLLIGGYAYHIQDRPVLSDPFWDWLCAGAAAAFYQLRHHHRHLITPDDLRAGSLYRLAPRDYPRIARDAARTQIFAVHGVWIDPNKGVPDAV